MYKWLFDTQIIKQAKLARLLATFPVPLALDQYSGWAVLGHHSRLLWISYPLGSLEK